MTKQTDKIKSDGVIVQTLGYENFRVRLENGIEILANVSGRLRQNHIRLMTGDCVEVELSPYDMTKGRIVYRKRTNH